MKLRVLLCHSLLICHIYFQCPVAVKKLRSDEHMPLNVMEEFRNEVKRMASLHHNHIVKLIGVSVDLSGRPIFVM